MEQQLEKYAQHFTQWRDLKLQVFTWNIAGEHPREDFDIGDLLISKDCETLPDIFVVGLQEMVKLNTKSIM